MRVVSKLPVVERGKEIHQGFKILDELIKIKPRGRDDASRGSDDTPIEIEDTPANRNE
jgi:hypothetical protein